MTSGKFVPYLLDIHTSVSVRNAVAQSRGTDDGSNELTRQYSVLLEDPPPVIQPNNQPKRWPSFDDRTQLTNQIRGHHWHHTPDAPQRGR